MRQVAAARSYARRGKILKVVFARGLGVGSAPMKAMISLAVLGACGGNGGVALEPPLIELPGTVDRIAINDTSIFVREATANALIELDHDGSMIGTIPTIGDVRELAAAGDLVAWVEVEGTGTVIKRRRGAAGAIESQRTFDAHIVANLSGLFYSDLGLIAAWGDGNPERIATPASTPASPRLLDVDGVFAYAVDDTTAVTQYQRDSDVTTVTLETSQAVSIKDGRLAYRTTEGIRVRDLETQSDGVAGFVPGSYECELLLVGQVVMCGKFRVHAGNAEEVLVDPIAASVGLSPNVYWVTAEADVSALRVTDVETIAQD